MELEGSQGDDMSSTVHEGSDRTDERATSMNAAPGSPAEVGFSERNPAGNLSGSSEDLSPMALVQRLRMAAEERSRELAKLREDTAALREEIAQLREQPGSMIEELNQLRAALAAAMEEISPGGATAPPPRVAEAPAEPKRPSILDEDDDDEVALSPPSPWQDPAEEAESQITDERDALSEAGVLPEFEDWSEAEPSSESEFSEESELIDYSPDTDPADARNAGLFRLRKRH